MKLTNRQIVALASALASLDGEPQPDGTVKPYKFAGNVRYAIARMTVALKPLVEAFEKARLAIIADFSGGRGGVSPADPKYVDCTNAVTPVLDTEVEVTLHQFKLADLNLDANAIAPGVLANLDPAIAPE